MANIGMHHICKTYFFTFLPLRFLDASASSAESPLLACALAFALALPVALGVSSGLFFCLFAAFALLMSFL